MAKLYFRYGSMNCGKSTALIQVAYNYEERGLKVLVVKPKVDTKGDNKVVSRIGAERKVDILLGNTDLLSNYNLDNVNCILVDEVQFLTPRQVDDLMEIAVTKNIPVICYGLRTDFRTQAFPGSSRLLAIAHSLEELKTISPDKKKAIFTIRKVNGVPTQEGSNIEIDNNTKIEYQSVSAEEYYNTFNNFTPREEK